VAAAAATAPGFDGDDGLGAAATSWCDVVGHLNDRGRQLCPASWSQPAAAGTSSRNTVVAALSYRSIWRWSPWVPGLYARRRPHRVSHRTLWDRVVLSGMRCAETATKYLILRTNRHGMVRAKTGGNALQNRCTATVLTRPASSNYNGYLNARSSETAVDGEIAVHRLISARRTPS
jgi:hypothetical protein